MAVETADAWNQSAIELIQEIGRLITAVTEDTRERLSISGGSRGGGFVGFGRTPLRADSGVVVENCLLYTSDAADE